MTRAADWQSGVGETWAREWRLTDRSFSELSPHLDAAIVAALPEHSFTAVDIGCGAGATALSLARARPDSRIIGIDLSASLIATATARSIGVDNAHFVHGDAATMAGRFAPVDLFCSRHGVMFFDDPVASFAAMHAAASVAGALVFTCFDSVVRNPWATMLGGSSPQHEYAPGPFGFADPNFVASTLAAAGWRDATPARIPFRYVGGRGDDPVDDALDFFERIGPVARALRDATSAAGEILRRRLREEIAAARDGDTVAFPASAWLWSAKA